MQDDTILHNSTPLVEVPHPASFLSQEVQFHTRCQVQVQGECSEKVSAGVNDLCAFYFYRRRH